MLIFLIKFFRDVSRSLDFMFIKAIVSSKKEEVCAGVYKCEEA